MKISCRFAQLEDTGWILDCMKDFYALEHIEFIREKSRKSLEYLIARKRIGRVWIIYSDCEPAGYFCLAFSYTLENYGRDCFLDELYIKPEYRSQGIGREVMKFIEAYLVRHSFKAIHLMVNDHNKKAFDYYIKNHFRRHKASFMTKLLN